MSENNQDNNGKDIIESEVESNDLSKQEIELENTEETQQDHQEEQLIEPTKETVVVKKGSFLSFLAFVFALAALGLSGYMYYLQYYKNKNTTTFSAWEQPIELVDKKITQLNQQIATLHKNNQQLTKQIVDISVKTTELQTLTESNTGETALAEQMAEKYDDTTLKSQLAEIEKKLSQPTNQQAVEKYDDEIIKVQIAEIQTKLEQATQTNVALQKQITDVSKHNIQVIAQLKKDIEIKQTQANSQQLISPVNKDMQATVIAQSFLQEAYIQLNINSNSQKTLNLLEKTRLQLQELSNPEFANLASELQQVSSEIAKTQILDTNEINQQISQLQKSSSNLTFAKVVNDENEKAAWYEKLVVIKKVDGSEQKRQSKSEQLSIKSTIKAKFSMLQVALMTKHQGTWANEIDSLVSLLMQNFAENSKDIQSQLNQLKSLDLNPEFPDLETYLNKLKNIDVATGG